MPALDRSFPQWPPYLWHHLVHERKRGERLFYWRIGFDPVYERDSVAAGIESACRQHGVKSVVAYELLGAYDVLVRAWLPAGCSFEAFNRTLTDELDPSGLAMCDPFEVDRMVRHWPFVDESGEQRGPEETAIARLDDADIEEIDTNYPDVDPDLVARLRGERLLAPWSVNDDELPGIKFAIEVSAALDSSADDLHALEQELVAIIDRTGSIAQRSLYAGEGFGHFLIMGRVDYTGFHAIHSDLITQINAAAIRERYGVRTLTHVSGQRGCRIAHECLSDGGGLRRHKGRPLIPRRRVRPDSDYDGHELTPGETFAKRFQIVELLGDGGFAHVYRAYDSFEGVHRALKIFRSSDPEVAMREIEALRKVSHPNVVRLHTWDHFGSHWYLVSEFIEGRSLDELEHGDDLWALAIAIQVLDALEAIHPDDRRIDELRRRETLDEAEFAELQKLIDVGLVHRDVKPANILVGVDGRVTLVDLNIASPVGKSGKTRKGTIAYLAPDAGFERWEPTDDLFACGVVLYELLVGQHPYAGGVPYSGMTPIDPLTVREDLWPPLAKILLRACAPLREDRYQTAREMRAALETQRAVLERRYERTEREASRAVMAPSSPEAITGDPAGASDHEQDRPPFRKWLRSLARRQSDRLARTSAAAHVEAGGHGSEQDARASR